MLLNKSDCKGYPQPTLHVSPLSYLRLEVSSFIFQLCKISSISALLFMRSCN